MHTTRVVDQDPDWIWISDFVDPDPYWESGSGGKKIKKFQWKNALYSYLKKKNLPLKRYKIALTTFWKKFWWITPAFFIWFDPNFDFIKIWERNCLRKFCFSLDPEPDPDWEKCWIRIRIKSIRIHNPAYNCGLKENFEARCSEQMKEISSVVQKHHSDHCNKINAVKINV
jgi:hypothetical protein